MKGRLIAAFIAAAFCVNLSAAPTDPHQYMVRKKYIFMQPNATAAPPIKDVVGQLGGHVDFDLRNWLVITIPDAAFQSIRQHPAVKYLQRVVSGPFVAPSTAATTAHPVVSTGRIAPNSSPPWTSGTYTYDGAGNISAIGTETYTYDRFLRLVQANLKGARTETYVYDAVGNLTHKTTHDPTKTPPDLPVDLATDTATNHLTAYTTSGYDAAGNLVGDSSEANAFDPVNMQREKDVPASGLAEIYVYNADDERIGVFECGGPPASCGNSTVIWSLRDESGKVLRQYESTYLSAGPPQSAPPWAWIEDYVYRGGLLLGAERVPEEGGRRHFHLDHLGTPRLVTGDGGARIAEHDYYPFGVEFTPVPQETSAGFDREEPMKFTGHLRDFNVGTSSDNSNYNDFMHSRNTVPQWGRFLSVDQIGGRPDVPQSWNRYAYARNSPLNLIDPHGTDAMDFRILTIPVNVIYAPDASGLNHDFPEISSPDMTLRQTAESSIEQARQFYAVMGIALRISRFESGPIDKSTINWQGSVSTPSGAVSLSAIGAERGRAINVLVTGGWIHSGDSAAPLGYTILSNGMDGWTLAHELAHQLGNIAPINDPVKLMNLGTDTIFASEHLSYLLGVGPSMWFENLMRDWASKMRCSQSTGVCGGTLNTPNK